MYSIVSCRILHISYDNVFEQQETAMQNICLITTSSGGSINKINFPVWSKFYTPKDVVGYWKPTRFEQTINIEDVEIHNNDYVMADIDGVVIIPQDKVIEILEKSEKLINTESQVRKAIREGMDPQEAYIKYSVF